MVPLPAAPFECSHLDFGQNARAHVCTILIVDDHQDSREAMAEIVRSEGHTYHEASNGREALDWLLAQSELPCMILLDLRMPVMDG